MPKVYAMIADGTEEVECLAVVDVLRRAGIETRVVSVGGNRIVGSHGIKITADLTADKADFTSVDMIFLPGGMPGAVNLASCAPLMRGIEHALSNGKRVAAICAAPAVVLGENGFLHGKKAVCYPGFENGLKGAVVMHGARVVTDGNITTALGPGCALELGIELASLLVGKSKAEQVKAAMQF